MSPEEAKKAAETARVEAEKAKAAFLEKVRVTWVAWANAKTMELVREQPSVLTSKATVDVTLLKTNLSNAVASAAQSVPTAFAEATDIDAMIEEARGSGLGVMRRDTEKPLVELARNFYLLIEDAGFSTRVGVYPKWTSAPAIVAAREVTVDFRAAESAFYEAVQHYRRALVQIKAAERDVEKAEAERLWDQA